MPAPHNPFKAALKAGKKQLGIWASFAHPYPIEMVASAGFDWIVIDGEHAPNDLQTITAQLQVLEDKHSHAVVRLPTGNDWLVKQVLDAGAQTVLVPMVNTAEEAAALVRAMRYPPDGIRGAGAAGARASRFGAITDYVTTANEQVCLLVQVETRLGMENLDAILEVEGVDGVFIGPADLAADLGHPGQSAAPDVSAAIQDMLARISASDKAAGILGMTEAATAQYASWGAQFLAVGVDVGVFSTAIRDLEGHWRTRL
ncbi:HpcH/HpaI aldolase/citrate lyase family protein [uncultured Lentibacter sp.]|uniref:HpcH/HpaI aldolase family protein n=1 Tax=uncultured Lentibacter sp. TaxID=1659309 RepID=UPI0026017EFB|nr:HpcH/HpaI aldolase/citrate lyase family protein [uncultured Lentibacter sp.]